MSIKNFDAIYRESITHVKDENSFWVRGKLLKYNKNSLGMVDNRTKLRFAMVWIITSKMFDNIVILLIFINSILLGIKDYTDTEDLSEKNRIINYFEPFFTYSFLTECICKVIGQGFMAGKNTYLSEAWNWLDFTVVITSLLESLPGMDGVKVLRTFRLLRPLRSLATMPSMKVLIGTLISSISQLSGIMGLAFFFFAIFSILGISLLDGKTHWRCYMTPEPDSNGIWEYDKTDR